MSESDTMFNERDRRYAAVQQMVSTDQSYDNRTIASTLKMQICIDTNNRDVPRVMKTKFRATVMVFGVVSSEGHIEVGLKVNMKCTRMCWRVWWSPGTLRWPVVDSGCGSRTRRRRTSPKDPGLASGVLRLHTLLSPDLNPLDYFVWSYVENITNMTTQNTKASLIVVIYRVLAELPPALVEKACSQFGIRIEAAIEAEGGYI